MRELVELQVNKHVATQQPIIKHQVDEIMVFVKGKTLLARLEEKSFAKFQEKTLELADDHGFEVALGIRRLFLQAEEFKDLRVFEHVGRPGNDVPFLREYANLFLVPAERQSFVQPGAYLALELWN